MTAAATFLAAGPYLNITVAKAIDWWVLALPVLATLLVAYGIAMLDFELRLLSLIRHRYRTVQREALDIEHRPENRFNFTRRVLCYLFVLFGLAAMPTFGLPCPTTIFTFAVLLWTRPRQPVDLGCSGVVGGRRHIRCHSA